MHSVVGPPLTGLEEVLVLAGEKTGEADTTNNSKYKQLMSLPALHYLTVWAIIYVGTEVTLGGTCHHLQEADCWC